jgi:hypothetical protein
MKIRKLCLCLAAALVLPPAAAQDDSACTLPGILVSEDPAGDHSIAPTGEGFPDILSLHMAEPGSMPGKLVFTYKMADLAVLPPDTLWILRFIMDELPAGAAEYFVAMLTDPSGDPHFVYGTAGPADPAGQAGLLFTPEGPLDAESNFNADGTITLILDKAGFPALVPGAAIYGMIPVTHRITPTDGTQPFYYGFRAVGAAALSYDDGSDGFYELVAEGACAGGGKLGFLGAGGLGACLLLPLGLIGFWRRAIRVWRYCR